MSRSYKINELFLSIQGEGIAIGHPSIFVRFSGCNLKCEFCDTAYETNQEMTVELLMVQIKDLLLEHKWPIDGLQLSQLRCVFTGGEPLLQLDEALVKSVRSLGLRVCVETNGTIESPVLDLCDEVVVSPKSDRVSMLVIEKATCVKALVPLQLSPGVLRKCAVKLGKNRILGLGRAPAGLIFQPITPREGFKHWKWSDACTEAMHLALTWRRDYRQEWRVVPQTHVIMGLR